MIEVTFSHGQGSILTSIENLNLKDKEFQPERDVVAEERRWRTENNPTGYLYFAMFNNAYVYHPYHWTPIGFMNDIQTWTIDDIKDFHQTGSKNIFSVEKEIIFIFDKLSHIKFFAH